MIATSAVGFWGRTIWILDPDRDTSFAIVAGYSDFGVIDYQFDLRANKVGCSGSSWFTPLAGQAVALPMPMLPDSLGAAPDFSVEWAPSTTIRPQTVAGRITGIGTAEPVQGAVVSLPRWGVEAVTTSDGTYELALPGPGDYVVNIDRAGFTTASARIDTALGGIELNASLGRWRPSCGVPCRGPGCRGVRVSVVDGSTGLAPAVEVSLTVSYESSPIATTRSSGSGQARLFLAAGEEASSDGPLSAEVSAIGYETVRLGNLWLDRELCEPRASAVHYVQLVPSARQGRERLP